MSEPVSSTAWLERHGADPIRVTGNCSLGRAVGNDVVLMDDRVSRRHATIHAQGELEFLLVDLGSRNGTYLNGRRVNQPTKLHDGDQLQMGPFKLVFHQSSSARGTSTRTAQSAQTLVELRLVPCWLLLCDIANSSGLARERGPEELAMLVGGWFARCKEAIEDNGGMINKYLGDGFLAYWRARPETRDYIGLLLRDLRVLQEQSQPRFRVVLHHGQVTMGGMPSLGEDSLAGPDVNLAFRLERLASSLGLIRLASAPAVEMLGALISPSGAGEHELAGFQGKHTVFTF